MSRLTVFVIHAYTPGNLPHPADELGHLEARDKYDALREARKMWPGKPHLIAQELGAVMTSAHAPKRPVDWAKVARYRRAR